MAHIHTHSLTDSHTHTHTHTHTLILARTPLDEGSARHTDFPLTTNNTHRRQIFMLQTGFETAIPASERPQTHTLDFTATDIGVLKMCLLLKVEILCHMCN